MRARTRSSALWGAVGGLTFLTLAQGYQLAVGALGVGLPVLLAVAVVVAVIVAALAYATEHRLATKGRT
ncbi:MAG: hypothetical protein ABEJ22_09475 [Haloferacaceae archaeon]